MNDVNKIITKEKDEKNPSKSRDIIENEIFQLFNTSIGENFEKEEFEIIKQEGLHRMKNEIPPGYKDADKEENGDYYIFYSIIQHALKTSQNAIFITDDTKEDWFNKINGEKHGGRYELLNEFYRSTGKLLMIYTSDGFLTSYNKNIKKKAVDENIIKELINIRKMDNQKSMYESQTKELYNLIRIMRNELVHGSPYKNKYNNIELIHLINELKNNFNPKTLKDERIFKQLIDFKEAYENHNFEMSFSIINDLYNYINNRPSLKSYDFNGDISTTLINEMNKIMHLASNSNLSSITTDLEIILDIINKIADNIRTINPRTKMRVMRRLMDMKNEIEQYLIDDARDLDFMKLIIHKVKSIISLIENDFLEKV